MAKNGFSTTGIAKGIISGSPNVEERKGRSVAAYADRTATAAMASPEIEKFKNALEITKKGKNKDRDHGFPP